MIEYIKKYGVRNIEFQYIVNNTNRELLELLEINEILVRDNLEYLNSIGIKDSIGKLIIKRPDLILLPTAELMKSFKHISEAVVVKVINKSIDDLIVIGI